VKTDRFKCVDCSVRSLVNELLEFFLSCSLTHSIKRHKFLLKHNNYKRNLHNTLCQKLENNQIFIRR